MTAKLITGRKQSTEPHGFPKNGIISKTLVMQSHVDNIILLFFTSFNAVSNFDLIIEILSSSSSMLVSSSNIFLIHPYCITFPNTLSTFRFVLLETSIYINKFDRSALILVSFQLSLHLSSIHSSSAVHDFPIIYHFTDLCFL